MSQYKYKPIPILFITDIGRDIDDTIALLACAAYQREGIAQLVGIIATGGAGVERARLARGWARRLGYSDQELPVAVCHKPGRDLCNTSIFPTPEKEDAALYMDGVEGSAADLIVKLATEHQGSLEVFAIGPLSALADAIETEQGLKAVREGVKMLHMQGQATFNIETQMLEPDFAAFNLSENKDASSAVFAKLQQYVPFRLLGKHAAYRVTIKKADFDEWDKFAGNKRLTETAKWGLEGLKSKMPEVFDRLYPLPPGKRDQEDWFDYVEEVSHPYDPLMVVAAFKKLFFKGDVYTVKGMGRGDDGVSITTDIRHVLIGSIKTEESGVPKPEYPYEELKRVVLLGISSLTRKD